MAFIYYVSSAEPCGFFLGTLVSNTGTGTYPLHRSTPADRQVQSKTSRNR